MGLRGIGFLLQCYLMLATAMYFDLGKQEEKCIIEEIPEDMLVTGESWRGNIAPECHLHLNSSNECGIQFWTVHCELTWDCWITQ